MKAPALAKLRENRVPELCAAGEPVQHIPAPLRDHAAEPFQLRAAHAVVHQVDAAPAGERQHAFDQVFVLRDHHMRGARIDEGLSLGRRAGGGNGDDAGRTRHLQCRDARAR
jgi:hypothetical protein